MGQRLTASGTILIDNAPIRAGEIEWRDTAEREDAVGRHAATFRQLYLAACVAGIVRNVLSDAVEFVRTKARPITHGHADRAVDDMFVQRTVGFISARSFAVDALIDVAAERINLAHEAVSKNAPEADRLLTDSVADDSEGTVGGQRLGAGRRYRNIRLRRRFSNESDFEF
jgi:hypothetical protein